MPSPARLAAMVLAGGVLASAPPFLFRASFEQRAHHLHELPRDLAWLVESVSDLRLEWLVLGAGLLAAIATFFLATRNHGPRAAKLFLSGFLVALHYFACLDVAIAIELGRIYSTEPLAHEPRPEGRVSALTEAVVEAFARDRAHILTCEVDRVDLPAR